MDKQVQKKIQEGEKILLFVDQFPIETIPKMKPILIEKLNHKEQKLYKAKYVYVSEWENWDGINKFLMTSFNNWYLVRIYES